MDVSSISCLYINIRNRAKVLWMKLGRSCWKLSDSSLFTPLEERITKSQSSALLISFSQQQNISSKIWHFHTMKSPELGLVDNFLHWNVKISSRWVILIRIVPALLANFLTLHWYFLSPWGKQKRGLLLMYIHSFLIYHFYFIVEYSHKGCKCEKYTKYNFLS